MRAHTHVHIHTWSSHFALSLHCHSSIPVCKMVSVLDWPGISVYRLNLINIHTPFRAAPLSPHSELWNQSQCDHYMIVSCYRARSTHLFMLCVSITFSYSKWVPVTRSPLNSKALCIHTPQIYTQGSVRFFPFVWLCFCLCFVFVLIFFVSLRRCSFVVAVVVADDDVLSGVIGARIIPFATSFTFGWWNFGKSFHLLSQPVCMSTTPSK